MSQANERFIPSGVNAQSWLGFEQRIQERRFRVLLDTMQKAIAAGDAVEGRAALEEAQELRPDAPELADVELKLAALVAIPSSASPTALWARAISAVAMLLLGVGLLFGMEWLRQPAASTLPAPVQASAPALVTARSPVLRVPAATAAPVADPVTIVPPPAADELVSPPAARASGGPTLRIDTRKTAPELRFRQATNRPEPSPAPAGETPDDFVFTPSATGNAAAGSPVASVARAATPIVTAVLPAPAPVVPPVVAVGAGTVPPATSIADESRVAAVLNQYARAYQQLDAEAARAVWPSVNERALARAFEGLTSQNVSFDDCAIDVRGATANASCRGTASYVGKVGSGERRTEARTWRFQLRRDGEAWKIASAEARAQ